MIAALSYAIELHVLMSQTEFFECPTLFLSITQSSAPKSFFKFSTFFRAYIRHFQKMSSLLSEIFFVR